VGRDGDRYNADLGILKIRIFFRKGLDSKIDGRTDLPVGQPLRLYSREPGMLGAGLASSKGANTRLMRRNKQLRRMLSNGCRLKSQTERIEGIAG
jgi:hypothetical protein